MTLIDSRPGIAATLRALSDGDGRRHRRRPRRQPPRPEARGRDGRVVPRRRGRSRSSDRYRELYADLGVPGTLAAARAPLDAVAAVRRAGGRTRRRHREVRAERAAVPRPRRPRGRRRRRLAPRPREGGGARASTAPRSTSATPRPTCAARAAAGAVAVGRDDRPARPRPRSWTRVPTSCSTRSRSSPQWFQAWFAGSGSTARRSRRRRRFRATPPRPLSITDAPRAAGTRPAATAKSTRSSLRTDADASTDCVDPAAGETVTVFATGQLDDDVQRERPLHVGEQLLVDRVHVDVLRGELPAPAAGPTGCPSSGSSGRPSRVTE